MASTKKKSDNKKGSSVPAPALPKHHHEENADKICHMREYMARHSMLAKVLPDGEPLFQCDGQAPSPSKDYAQLQITLDKVILRWWKITLRNIDGSMYPGEIKDSYEDFYYDEVAQREIWRFFGKETVDYCLNIVTGKYDWLTRLPINVQVHILSFVNLDDIPQVSLVSKSLRSLCRNNDLWRIFYINYYGQHALDNRDLINLAEQRGWRHVFFTNRLKLQMQLRRAAQIERHHPEDPSDFVKARERRSQIQPSPPSTPRQQERSVQQSLRRHSFATRKERQSDSPRASPLPDRLGSPRLPQSYLDDDDESPRMRRPISPSSSVRSNAGSVASSASAQPPVRQSHGTSKRH